MTTDCGLVDETISASEKDLPVNKSQSIPNFFPIFFFWVKTLHFITLFFKRNISSIVSVICDAVSVGLGWDFESFFMDDMEMIFTIGRWILCNKRIFTIDPQSDLAIETVFY